MHHKFKDNPSRIKKIREAQLKRWKEKTALKWSIVFAVNSFQELKNNYSSLIDKKISASKKGHLVSDATREKIRAKLLGRKRETHL